MNISLRCTCGRGLCYFSFKFKKYYHLFLILYDVIRNIFVVSLHFVNRRSYCYYKQYCIQKAINEIDDALLKDKKASISRLLIELR